MASENNKTLITITAVVLSGMLCFYGWKLHAVFISKANAQLEVVESLNRWSQQYLAMEDVKKNWESNFEPESKVKHISGLYDLIGFMKYGLQNDKDSISLSGLSQVMQQTQKDMPLGLTKICMTNGSLDSTAVIVGADNYSQLLNGIEKIANRKDIIIDNVTIQGDKNVPIARLGGFCIQVRN